MRFAGRIFRTHGTQGHLICGETVPHFRGFEPGMTLNLGFSASFTKPFVVAESKQAGVGQWMVRFKGIDSPEVASKLREQGIFLADEVIRAAIDVKFNEQFFDDEIVGCRVVNRETGEELGKIKEIWETSAHEIWVVDYKGKELPIPVIDEIIKHVNIARKTVSIYVMPGLLEIVDETSAEDERDDDKQ